MQNELYHHGVKGMKWGVRRYQNSDGSLTSEGQKRLSDYKNKHYKKTNRYRAKTLAATEQDTISKVKKRQSLITNKLDPTHQRTDKAIKSNNEFTKTANQAYSSINKSLKNLTYSDMMKEKRNVATVRAGAAFSTALLTGGFAAATAAGLPITLVMAGAGAVGGLIGANASGASENVRYRTRKYNEIMKEQ